MASRLREALRECRPQYGLWVTMESPSISEVAAELACDWICVDMEHGHLGFREVLEHARRAVTVRHERGSEPGGLGLPEDGHRPLAGDERLVVSADHDLRMLAQCVANESLG